MRMRTFVIGAALVLGVGLLPTPDPAGAQDLGLDRSHRKLHGGKGGTDIDFAAARADADARAKAFQHNNQDVRNKQGQKQNAVGLGIGVGGSAKADVKNKNVNTNTATSVNTNVLKTGDVTNVLKTGDIINNNINENKQTLNLGTPSRKAFDASPR
jgi:hypothetical protein